MVFLHKGRYKSKESPPYLTSPYPVLFLPSALFPHSPHSSPPQDTNLDTISFIPFTTKYLQFEQILLAAYTGKLRGLSFLIQTVTNSEG